MRLNRIPNEYFITALVSVVFLLNFLYLYTSNITLLKWQLINPMVFLSCLFFQKSARAKIRSVELFLLLWMFYSLLLFSVSEESKYINYFVGIFSALALSRLRFSYSKVLLVSGSLFCLHNLFLNLVPSYDYVAQFSSMNETWGANRVSFIIFFLVLALFDTHRVISYIFFFIMLLYTSRLNIMGAIIYLLFRERFLTTVLVVVVLGFVASLIFEPWMFHHYLFKLDFSVFDRLERYGRYLYLSAQNAFFPVFDLHEGQHALFFELLISFGIMFIPVFLSIFIITKRKFSFIVFCIFAIASKQIHDLGFFYLFLAWYIMPKNSIDLKKKSLIFKPT